MEIGTLIRELGGGMWISAEIFILTLLFSRYAKLQYTKLLPFCKYLLKYLTFFFIVLKLCVFTIAYHPTMLHPSAVFLLPGAAAQKEVFPHDSYSD